MGHHTDCRLAGVQVHRQAGLVGIAEPEVLVVERARRRADHDSWAEDRSAEDRDHTADGRALAGASLADLVLLELAVRVEGQNADGIAVGNAGVLQFQCGGVGGALIREDSEYELPVCHRWVPSAGWRRARRRDRRIPRSGSNYISRFG